MADPYFGQPGRVDLLLGVVHTNQCSATNVMASSDRKFRTTETMFGWVIEGGSTIESKSRRPTICLRADLQEIVDKSLRFCLQEEVPEEETTINFEDQKAIDQFQATTIRSSDGRYEVHLPRKEEPPMLGESCSIVERRFFSNEHSLRKKNILQAYTKQVRDYMERGHAENVFTEDMMKPPSEHYYMPMHGVEKATSTTTKLRVVCDASDKTMSGVLLNVAGPSLYPKLSAVLLKFRLWDIAYSADMAKMFREVSLAPSEQDFHQFLARDDDGHIADYQMSRVTFGVKLSPFLASAVLTKGAIDYADSHPTATLVVSSSMLIISCGVLTVWKMPFMCSNILLPSWLSLV